MREELRNKSTIGNLSGIEFFISILIDNSLSTYAAISSLCSFVPSSKLNYLAALYMFDDLGIINIQGDCLSLTQFGSSLKEKSIYERLVIIGKAAIARVIEDGLLNCNDVRFSLESGSIEIPISAFSLASAVYRNFLISIKAFDVYNNILQVAPAFESSFEMLCAKEKQRRTQEDLLKQLEAQQQDGDKAELYVVEYENRRLSKYKKTAKRISQIDVTAGYDILSFEDQLSIEYDRFIEVKSYHGKPHFYWTENERNTSRALKERYYLFLVDIDQIKDKEYAPMVICDPYNNLSDEIWLMKPHSFFVCQI